MKFSRTKLGPHFSEAARSIFQRYVVEDRWSITFLARILEMRSGHLSQILYGDTLPSIKVAVKMLQTLGTEAHLWVEPPLKKFVPPAARGSSGTDMGTTR